MDPDSAHWTRDMFSMEQVPWMSALKLEVVCSKLLPGRKRLMSKRHSARADAQLVTMFSSSAQQEERFYPNRPDEDCAMA